MIRFFFSRKIFFILMTFSVLSLSACTSAPDSDEFADTDDIVSAVVLSQDFITRATWSADRERMTVRGDANPGDTTVYVYNVANNDLIGTVSVDADYRWRLRQSYSSNAQVPCRVRAVTNSVSAERDVNNAPSNCIAVTASTNEPPNGTIVRPQSNLAITAGERVYFSASASDPENDAISYSWNFDGATNDSNVSTPGYIVFNQEGNYRVSLSVSDSAGNTDPTPSTRTITVLPANQAAANHPPVASIISPATDRTIAAGESIQFSGNATDPDDDATSVFWNFFGLAPNSSRLNPPAVRFSTPGVYAVSLSATDSHGLQSEVPDVVTITVTQAQNAMPNSLINSPQNDVIITAGQSVYFTGSGFDPDNNNPMSFSWNFGGGAGNSFVQNPGNVVFATPGIYQVQLTVTDALGLSDATPATRRITVNGVQTNEAPNGVITRPSRSSITVNVGDSIELRGDGSDPENDAMSFFWDMHGLAPNSRDPNPGLIYFHNAGTYRISLTVTDSHGNVDPTPAVLEVIVHNDTALNVAPNGTISSPTNDMTINRGDSLSFTGDGFDPDSAEPLRWLWNFDGARSNSTRQNPGNVQFNQAGIYRVSLTVTDSLGLSDTSPSVRVITVRDYQPQNQAPTGQIISPSTDVEIVEGETVYFAATASDPDNNFPLQYHWSFDGGAPNTFSQVPGNVVFSSPGTYRVQLHVQDALGLQDPQPQTRVITVTANTVVSNPPNGVIDAPSSDMIITVGEQVTFRGSGIDPGGHYPLTYRWSFDGAAPDVIAEDPGNVSFNRVGTYRVRLTVTNALGLSDQVPAERIIMVESAEVTNLAPSVVINSPLHDEIIYAGDSIFFSASGSDPDDNLPLRYFWSFDGAAPNMVAATPGDITFSQPGVYRVRVSVSDSLGLSSEQFAERVITVNGGVSNTPPVPTITYPLSNVSIVTGESVYFSGSGVDADGHYPLTYVWLFDGAVANRVGQTPGYIRFDHAGVYRIQLWLMDSLGAQSNHAAEIVVTVNDVTALSNTPPNGSISSPATDMIIDKGQSIEFRSTYYDADGDSPQSYFWNFDGATWNRSTPNPGLIRFEEPGVYHVQLTVTDARGERDPTPSERIITVRD